MKRSKVFLGATAGLLALVAFASAKAKRNSVPAAYISAHKGDCIPVANVFAQTVSGGTPATFDGFQLYTDISPTPCVTPLYQE